MDSPRRRHASARFGRVTPTLTQSADHVQGILLLSRGAPSSAQRRVGNRLCNRADPSPTRRSSHGWRHPPPCRLLRSPPDKIGRLGDLTFDLLALARAEAAEFFPTRPGVVELQSAAQMFDRFGE